MLKTLALAAAAAAVAAQPAATWYGASPDDTLPGVVNLFTMTPDGNVVNAVASIVTSDKEYPKTGTLKCLWGSPVCYFLTGVESNNVQDALYAVNTTDGRVLFKHTIPAGIYVDNLQLDWETDSLYSVAFDTNAGTARFVSWNGTTGAPSILLDVSRIVGPGFIFPSDITICPTTKHVYVGVAVPPGVPFGDYAFRIDYSTPVPTVGQPFPLAFPVPSGLHAFCNASGLQTMAAITIQADSAARETLLVGSILDAGREGLFVPAARVDLPTFSARGEVPLYLNGLFSEFAGAFVAAVYPPYNPGPGPAPTIPFGGLAAIQFTPGGPARGSLAPLNFYLAGLSGVPAQ